MAFDPNRIVRPHLKPAALYTPGASPVDDPEAVRLDWNESPYPLSPSAQAVFDAYRSGNRYPTFDQRDLIAALAAYTGAAATRIVAGSRPISPASSPNRSRRWTTNAGSGLVPRIQPAP